MRIRKAYINLLLIIALTILTVSNIIAYRQIQKSDTSNFLISHTHNVLQAATNLHMELSNLDLQVNQYFLLNQALTLTYLTMLCDKVQNDIALLRHLTRDNPVQQKKIDKLASITKAKIAFLKEALLTKSASNQSINTLLRIYKNRPEFGKAIPKLINEIKQQEMNLLKQREKDYQSSAYTSNFLFLLIAMLSCGLLLLTIILVNYFLKQRDLAELDKQDSDERVKYLSSHDPLTNLYNRSAFIVALKNEILKASQQHTLTAIMMIDLDSFKTVNENFGHLVGDQLLKLIGEQLKRNMHKINFVARFGGDEFVIILPDVKDETNVKHMAKALINRFNRLFEIDGHYFHSKISIGVAIFPNSGVDEVALVKNAGIALYSAKEAGGNHYQIYSEKIRSMIKYRSQLESMLPNAIEKNQLFLVYQPQYSLPDRRVIGMEVLLRWQHPELGLVSPSNFIPIAEANGIIIQMGEWVLRNACAQYVAWQSNGLKIDDLKLSVNVSPKQLSERFLDSFATILNDTKMSPHNLVLELTESAVMTSALNVDPFFETLKNMGISISIDDFGMGYSSLSRLANLPISSLKIDKSFIDILDKDPNVAVIVKSIIALGNSLGLNVIPEGVETDKQLQLLIEYQCKTVQGFYFGKEPLRADDIVRLLLDRFH